MSVEEGLKIDIDPRSLQRHLEVISRTGKLIFGFRQSRISILNKKAKMVILASNCPARIEREIKIVCKIANTPYIKAAVSSKELGYMAGNPFSVSVLSIIDFGASTLREKIEQVEE